MCLDAGRHERWRGYETTGLLQYVDEFLDEATEQREPFCLFIAPHMPHHGGAIPGGRQTQDASPNGRLAPDDCLRRVPEQPVLPPSVPPDLLAEATDCYRDYLAMTVAVDDMLGAVLRRLRRDGLLDDTIVVFGSDHGSLMGAHGLPPWQKRTPLGGERVGAAGGTIARGPRCGQCVRCAGGAGGPVPDPVRPVRHRRAADGKRPQPGPCLARARR